MRSLKSITLHLHVKKNNQDYHHLNHVTCSITDILHHWIYTLQYKPENGSFTMFVRNLNPSPPTYL